MALRLAAEGYDITATGRRANGSKRSAAKSKRRRRCTALVFDVRSEARSALSPLNGQDLPSTTPDWLPGWNTSTKATQPTGTP
ncbi:MAG: hypothetical protein ACLRM8_00385 [Alistipes sp.]